MKEEKARATESLRNRHCIYLGEEYRILQDFKDGTIKIYKDFGYGTHAATVRVEDVELLKKENSKSRTAKKISVRTIYPIVDVKDAWVGVASTSKGSVDTLLSGRGIVRDIAPCSEIRNNLKTTLVKEACSTSDILVDFGEFSHWIPLKNCTLSNKTDIYYSYREVERKEKQ